MLSNKVKKILEEVLTDKQIRIYMAAMQGPCSVQELAQKSSIDRVQTYQVVKDLCVKGPLSQEIKKHGRTIIAEHPKKLVNLLGNKQRKIRRHELELQELLPEILGDYDMGGFRPKVKFYEGKEGYFSICEETLNSGVDEILQIGNVTELHKIIGEDYDLNYYAPKRVENKIFTKIVTNESEFAKKELMSNEKFLREIKFLPQEFLSLSFKYIYSNKVAIISSAKELIALIFESHIIADMERKTFEFIWEKLSFPTITKTKGF